jgi:iron complex outermembrane receptor protein
VLDQILVTAERRKEKMQNVPISIISLSGDALQNSGYHR